MSKTFHKIKLFTLKEWSNFIDLLIYGSYTNHVHNLVVQMYSVSLT